jgi:hypothetical protein
MVIFSTYIQKEQITGPKCNNFKGLPVITFLAEELCAIYCCEEADIMKYNELDNSMFIFVFFVYFISVW